MANVLKYKTSQPTKRALRKGNVVLGIGEENYGPSSTTGYYSGIDVPEGGYVVYTLGANNNPKVFVSPNDEGLIDIARTLGGGVLTVRESKNYLQTLANTWILDNIPQNKVTDGLILDLNAKSQASFIDNIPTTNLITANGLDFTTMSTYGYLSRTQVSDSKSPSGYACEMSVQNAAVINNSSRIRFGDATNIPTSGNAFISVWVKFEGGPTSNIVPRVYTGTTWWDLSPLDGGSPYLTSEYRRFGVYASLGTGSGGPNPGFSMTQNNSNVQTGQVTRWHSPQVELQTLSTDFVSGSRSQNTIIYDLSGNGNNGTLANGTTFDSRGWFDFDGTDDEITVPDNSTLDLTTDMSFEFLVKADSSQNNPYPRLIDKSAYLVHLSQTSPFSIAQNVNTSSGLRQTAVGSAFSSDTWTHILTTYNGQVGKIYTNGKLISTNSWGSVLGATTNGTTVTIGGDTGTSRQLNGSMAKTKVYNRALSESEVKQNYYGGPIVTDGLVFATDAGNLVSYESGSTTTYSMTGSYSGSLDNGATYTDLYGGGFDFDGSNDHITCDDSTKTGLNFGTGDFTLEAWFRPIDNSNSWTGVMVKGGSGAPGYAMTYRAVGSGIDLKMDIDAPNNKHYQSGYLTSGEVYHIVMVYDRDTAGFVYNNGELTHTHTDLANQNQSVDNSSFPLQLGTYDGGSWFMEGNIYAARVYDRALTSDEVLQNFNAQKARFGK